MKKYWFILLLAYACGSSKEDPNLAQAMDIHNEATKIGHSASMSVSQLKSLEAKMKQPQLDSLNAITTDLSEWYETLVEVPGNEHEDHDGHDHDHDHQENYLEGLSSEDILAIQAELKKQIQWIDARVNNLMNDVRANDNEQ
ncbi:MAG: hypothetical protein R8G66_18575 [Cytophagales bacterium]|nr:hypothetical protein [Cytophagales bacterium]